MEEKLLVVDGVSELRMFRRSSGRIDPLNGEGGGEGAGGGGGGDEILTSCNTLVHMYSYYTNDAEYSGLRNNNNSIIISVSR